MPLVAVAPSSKFYRYDFNRQRFRLIINLSLLLAGDALVLRFSKGENHQFIIAARGFGATPRRG